MIKGMNLQITHFNNFYNINNKIHNNNNYNEKNNNR